MERAGTTLKRHLQKSDPFRKGRCTREDCMVCRSEGRGRCNATGVTYELVCEQCHDKYIGETARSAYSRGKEHTEARERNDESSVMCRHAYEKHEGNMPGFKMNVTGVYRNDALMRQITESVRMNKVPPGKLINNKSEWNHINMPRASIIAI